MIQQAAYTSSYSNEVKEMKEQMKLLLEQNKLLFQKLSVSESEPSRPNRKSKARKEQERKEHKKKTFSLLLHVWISKRPQLSRLYCTMESSKS